MRVVLGLTLAVLFGSAAPAYADTVFLDPLHLCSTAGCTGFNGVTIGTPSSLSGWGFSSSPASQAGTLTIDLLVPQNEFTTIPTISGTDAGHAVSGTFVNIGTFSAGQKLVDIAGFPGTSPPNPFDAYQPATTALDPGFTALSSYVVLQALMSCPTCTGNSSPPVANGQFVTGSQAGQTSSLNNTFTLSDAAIGSIITGFLDQGTAGVISTAQSSSLIFNTPQVPLPGALWLFGSALVGLIGFGRKWAIPSG